MVDDAEQGVTQVIRGGDLLSSTPRQIALQRALGLPTPIYGHLPLIVGTDGTKLGKRDGALPLPSLHGIRVRDTLAAALRVLGIEASSMGEAIPQFDPKRIVKGSVQSPKVTTV